MMPYILILIMAAAILYLYKRLKKLENSQLTVEDMPNGDVVIKRNGKIIYNSK